MGNIEQELRAIRLALVGAKGFEQQTLSVEEAAHRLVLTQKEVRELLANGALRWILVGRQKRIPRHLIDRLAPL